MPKKSKSSKSKSKSKSKSSSSSSSSKRDITTIQKKLAFLKLLLSDNEYLNSDICREISKEISKSMQKYNKAAGIIQNRYRTKKYEEEMMDKGYDKLPCGNWSNGGQCMCDICYGF